MEQPIAVIVTVCLFCKFLSLVLCNALSVMIRNTWEWLVYCHKGLDFKTMFVLPFTACTHTIPQSLTTFWYEKDGGGGGASPWVPSQESCHHIPVGSLHWSSLAWRSCGAASVPLHPAGGSPEGGREGEGDLRWWTSNVMQMYNHWRCGFQFTALWVPGSALAAAVDAIQCSMLYLTCSKV